jgi:hypothetical protein
MKTKLIIVFLAGFLGALLTLSISGCGRSQESLSDMFQVSKCDNFVYIDSGKVAHFNVVSNDFEKICRFTMGTDSQGNPIKIFQDWRNGWRAVQRPNCGFWALADGELTTYDNKELDLSNTPDIDACPN